jgi:ABC-type Fe3+ transport system permease subunit
MKIQAESKADHITKPLEKMLQESFKNSDSVHALGFAQVKTLTLCIFFFIVFASCNRNSGSLVMQITALLLLLFVALESLLINRNNCQAIETRNPHCYPDDKP